MDTAQRLRAAAAEVAGLRALRDAREPVRSRYVEVKDWQAKRLAATHADLLGEPRYDSAARFFLDQIYGAKDFSQRDAELARAIPTLTRFLPQSALETIADAVELDALSERLDLAVATAVAADPAARGRPLDAALYGAAYRQAGSRSDRERQIELVDHIGAALDRLVRHPMLGRLLSAMEGPARMVGMSAMHEFLDGGFKAFRAMRGAGDFLRRVRERETDLMQRLYAGDDSVLP